MGGLFVIVVAVLIVTVLLVRGVCVVPPSKVFVIERANSFYAEWGEGVHMLIPVIDCVAGRVSLEEQIVECRPQPFITKDNVTVQINAEIAYQAVNAEKYVYEINDPAAAVEKLLVSALRSLVGEIKYDDLLCSRGTLDKKLTLVLGQGADRWGMKVNNVRIKDIVR